MRKGLLFIVLFFIGLLFGLSFATYVHAGSLRWEDECTQKKIAALQGVTVTNAATKLNQNFNLNRLGAGIIGGTGKWNSPKNTKERNAITALFTDPVCIRKIYKQLEPFKNGSIDRFKKETSYGLSVSVINAGKEQHNVTIVFDRTCTIQSLCVKGSGCMPEAFRIYCSW